ncbi:MAG: S-layer homology domain-containing protein [Clostridiaceae bacterium]|nr:S-layer homology domain-containing protein [Clostridiaceae bacterium]
MKRERTKKVISMLLTICLLFSLLPAISPPVAAASSPSSTDDENALSALGFDTSAEPDGYDDSESAANPYGVDSVTVAPVSELYTATPASGALYGDGLKLYATQTEFYADKDTLTGLPSSYSAYRSAAGCFDGSGLSGQVATAAVKSNVGTTTTYDLDLFLTDPASGESSAAVQLLTGCSAFANAGKGIEDYSDSGLFLRYLQIAAGDFNGDGTDEIAVYIPEQGSPRIEVYQLQAPEGETWQTASAWELRWTYYLSFDTYVPNLVSLTTGDMTGDGVDDLGITWGTVATNAFGASKAVVLHGDKTGSYLQESSVFNLSYNGYGITRAAMALGDVDGDGKNELVIAGQSLYDMNSKSNIYTRYIATYDFYNETGAFTLSASGDIDLGSGYMCMPGFNVNIALVKQDGPGTQEYVYLDGTLYQQSNSSFSVSKKLWEGLTSTPYYEYGAVAGDFNGDGKETVISYIAGTRNYLVEVNTGAASGSVYRAIADYDNTDCQHTFAAPDTDTDTMLIQYTGKHYLQYSDPKILAVLAAPPYFGDLAHLDGGDSYIGNSETVYGTVSGSGYSDVVTASFTAGAFVSFEQEINIFGFKAEKYQAEVEVTATATLEFEWNSQKTQTVEYGTMGGQDTVALYSVPCDVYVYDAYVPVTQGSTVVYEKQAMNITIPYSASVKTLTVQNYDEIAKNYTMLPTIEGNVLTSTLGDPATYPNSTAGYSGISVYSGDYAGVAYGSGGYIKQTLEFTDEYSHSQAISAAINFKTGGGGAGISVGVVGGVEAGYGNVVTNLTGHSFSGTVVGMPEEAEGYGYSYNWKIFKFTYTGEQTFPVVTYLVDQVASPPKLPTDLEADMDQTTSDSIMLTWTSGGSTAAGYQIYRHYDFPDGSGDYPVGGVISASDSKYFDYDSGEYHYYFEDTGLNPYTQYEYRIQAIGGTNPYYSVLSDVLSARTKASVGQPSISLSADHLLVYPDRNYSVTATVVNDAENAQTPLYQWQKNVDGVWTSLTGKTSAALTFSSTASSGAGEYRCRINQIVGEYAVSAYSDIVTVEFSKRTANMELNAVKDSTADMNPSVTAKLTNPHTDSGSVPTGTVTFEITGSGYSRTYTASVAGGTATLTDWTAPQAGAYRITAYYSGSRIFKAVSEDTLFLAGNSDGYWLDMPGSIVYGESLNPTVSMYFYDTESKIVQTELTGNDTDHYALSYKVSKSISYWESPTAVTQYINNTYSDPILRIILTQIYAMSPFFTVWIPLDGTYSGFPSPVSGDTIQPKAAGYYQVEITISDTDSGAALGTVSSSFSVIQRAVEITAPTVTAAKVDVVQPTSSQLSVTSGSLAFSDSFASLGLGVRCLNSAGTAVTLSTSSSPGVYTTQVTADSSYWAAQQNYSFSFVNGVYTVTGPTYPVTISTEQLLGKDVGDVRVLSPTGYVSGSKYQYGTEIVFVAEPDEGYDVAGWIVNGSPVDMDTLGNGKTLTQTMAAAALDVKVSFKVKETQLYFSGTHGSVECTNSGVLASGAIVIEGAQYTFRAVPDEGWHFKEWRLVANGISYPEGDVDAEGFHTYALTMGSVSTSLIAVFERDDYVLTLGDHLRASYYWDDDSNSTTPAVIKYVSSGAEIPGDTEVTVEPVTGWRITSDSKWYINGTADVLTADDPSTPDTDETEYYNGQSYTFSITDTTEIDADTELQYFSVTVSQGWSGGGENPGGSTVMAAVNDVETTLESLSDIAGGSKLVLTAVPAYGAVFEKWTVNGEDVDPGTLAMPNVYSCTTLGKDLDVEAVFAANDAYTISVTKDSHGSLSYTLNGGTPVVVGSDSADIQVYKGDTLVFTASPEAEFMVGGWTIDGVRNQTTVKTWTLADIDADIALDLNFVAKVYYTVNFSAGPNGRIAAVMDGDFTLASGEKPGGGTDIVFTATPDAGYMVDHWTVNGKTLETGLGTTYVDVVYEIPALSGDTTVQVTFRTESKWMMSVEQPENAAITGAISPDDNVWASTGYVRDGAAAVFTVTPDEDYAIVSAEVSGAMAEAFDSIVKNADGSWTCTISSVSEDLTVSAEAARIYSIIVASAAGGTASASTANSLAGKRIDITSTAASGYEFSGWTAAPAEMVTIDTPDASSTYFIMPASDVTITPAFTRLQNGGGGDLSGGGTSEILTAEVRTSQKTVFVPYELDSGEVSLNLSASLVEKLIAAGVGDTGITIDLGGVDGAKRAVIPSGSGILEQGRPFAILLPEAGIVFDTAVQEVLSLAADGGDLSVGAERVDKSVLTAAQRTQVGEHSVYSLTALAHGKTISNLGGTATVTIPYTLSSGESPEGIQIWYLGSDGELSQIACVYSEASGTITFETDHFSYYAIGYDESAGWANPFKDVLADAWYYKSVAFVSTRGLFNGTSDTIYSPDAGMTRAMFVTVLGRLAGVDQSQYTGSGFDDVADGSWYSAYVAWASKEGIVNGYGNRLFGPDDFVTREQMAAILARYAEVMQIELPGTKNGLTLFADSNKISGWAEEPVRLMQAAGILQGSGDNRFNPKKTATRVEVAAVLMRFVKVTAK